MPKWVTIDTFDIEARAPNSNATKDRMRLMMQSLLTERFHLAAHFEAQTLPVFALVLAKPGKLGRTFYHMRNARRAICRPAIARLETDQRTKTSFRRFAMPMRRRCSGMA